MQIKQIYVSLLTTCSALVLGTYFTVQKSTLKSSIALICIPFVTAMLHIMPLFIPLFTSLTYESKTLIKFSIFVVSCILAAICGKIYKEEKHRSICGICLLLWYIGCCIAEISVFVAKWIQKKKKRRVAKKTMIVKRKKETEIKMPPITVSTEGRHLRTKTDFVINGTVYIRKGETVELLKMIGSYYSVRNAIGIEYIVPKTNFY